MLQFSMCPFFSAPQSTAAVGEDILSGAYARREQEATLEIAGLKALLAKAQDQVIAARRGGLSECDSFSSVSLSSLLSASYSEG